MDWFWAHVRFGEFAGDVGPKAGGGMRKSDTAW